MRTKWSYRLHISNLPRVRHCGRLWNARKLTAKVIFSEKCAQNKLCVFFLTLARCIGLCAVVLDSFTVSPFKLLLALTLVVVGNVEAFAVVLTGIGGTEAHRNLQAMITNKHTNINTARLLSIHS